MGMNSGNKEKILKAAEELIPQLGIQGTTIAKVARAADVADSLVYKYFSGKEDLLFSVADIRILEALSELEEQLQGLTDPESRLRKMIWHSLRYNDRHPDYVRILLFECRSNARFYHAPSYDLMRRHNRITGGILKQGVKDGVFRPDANMRLVRELIYGSYDMAAISSLAVGEIRAGVDEFEDLVSLIMDMIRQKPGRSEPGREDRILRAAEVAFSRHGFSNTRVSDVADLAGVAEGSIYDLFKTKENLITAIAEKRFKKHLEKLPEIFSISDCARKLRRLMRYHFTLYMPNRDFLKVFLLDMQLNLKFYQSEAYGIFRRYITEFEAVLEEGLQKGDFKPRVRPRVFRNAFLGAFSHMALRWILFEDPATDKMMEIDQLIDMMTSAVIADT